MYLRETRSHTVRISAPGRRSTWGQAHEVRGYGVVCQARRRREEAKRRARSEWRRVLEEIASRIGGEIFFP